MKKIAVIILFAFLAGEAGAQAWIQRTNFGGVGRHRASGFAIGNRGYLGIGHVNGNSFNISYKDWWEYDPASDSWTQKADYPVPNYGAIAFATDSRGYIGGGAALNGEFYEYNPQTNQWTQIQNCPVSPGDQGSFCVNNKGYVILGSALYEYDPGTGNWTAKQSAPVTFGNWCSGFGIGSVGYIKSGTVFYEYKPLYNQWTQRASFPGVASNGSGAFVRNNKGYIITGYVGSLTNVTTQVWEYNPGNNTWTQYNDFPGTSRRFSVAFSINNRGYFGTGTNGINFNDFWELNDNVSVDEIPLEGIQLTAYPNPAVEEVHFAFSGYEAGALEKTEVRLFSSDGRLTDVVKVTGGACTIGRNDKAAGTYVYHVLSEGKTVKTGQIIFTR